MLLYASMTRFVLARRAASRAAFVGGFFHFCQCIRGDATDINDLGAEGAQHLLHHRMLFNEGAQFRLLAPAVVLFGERHIVTLAGGFDDDPQTEVAPDGFAADLAQNLGVVRLQQTIAQVLVVGCVDDVQIIPIDARRACAVQSGPEQRPPPVIKRAFDALNLVACGGSVPARS